MIEEQLTQRTTSSMVTTLIGNLLSYFTGNHPFSHQDIQISPVIKGSQTEYQISKNQFDDHQEDIDKLMQSYHVILSIKNQKVQRIEIAHWQNMRKELRDAITWNYRKAHILNKSHYNRLINRLKKTRPLEKKFQSSRVYKNSTEADGTLINPEPFESKLARVSRSTVDNHLITQKPPVAKTNLSDSIDLGKLNGRNGFVVYGAGQYNFTGTAVSRAGDINNDGVDDFITCASGFYDGPPFYTPTPIPCHSPGACYVIFGQKGNFSASIHLSRLADLNGFIIIGEDICDGTGISADNAGDVNGDGIEDIIIGASLAYNLQHQNRVGRAYVVFGKNTGNGNNFNKTFFLSSLDGSNGFKIVSNNSGLIKRIGQSVTGGDFNGDGISDIAIGAPSKPGVDWNSSACYVIFGKNTHQNGPFNQSVLLDALNGTEGVTITRTTQSNGVGTALSMGDVNGDGMADLLIGTGLKGAEDSSGSDKCCLSEAYLIVGRTYFYSTIYLEDGVRMAMMAIDEDVGIGNALTNVGDVNGDGLSDIALNGGCTVYLILGQKEPFSLNIDLESLDSINGSYIDLNGPAGCVFYEPSINTNGDLNADGINDMIISGYTNIENPGEAYVLFGKNGSFSTHQYAENNDQGFWINYNCDGNYDCSDVISFGSSVSSAGDVNHDGYDDLLIGASSFTIGNESYAGLSFTIFGGPFIPPVKHSGHHSRILSYLLYGGTGALVLLLSGATVYAVRYLRLRWQNNSPLLISDHPLDNDEIVVELSERKPLLSSHLNYTSINLAVEGIDELEQPGKEETSEAELSRCVIQAADADKKNELEKARTFLSNAQAQDPQNRTLLQLAIRYGCVNFSKQLLRDGVNPHEAADNTLRPIDLVKTYSRHALQGPIHRAIHQYKLDQEKEACFQRLLAKTSERDLCNVDIQHLIIDEQTLHNRILVLTNTDSIGKAVSKINQAKVNLPAEKWKAIRYLIKPLLKRILPSYQLLRNDKSREDKFRNFLTRKRYTYTNTVLSNLRQLCNDIKSAQEKIPEDEVYTSIYQALGSILRVYDIYVKQITTAKTPKEKAPYLNPRARIRGADINHRELNPEAEKLLLHLSDQSNVSQGTHVVKAVGGIHFKADPYAPGVEFMVNSLVNLVAGYGVPPTKLLKVCHEKKSCIYIASKTVEGVTLDFILEKHPDLINEIDSSNFSSMFVLGLLTNPQDGKADNYMVKLALDEQGNINKIYIIGIDNDIAFADAIIQSHNGEHYVNVKNILYFFPQMEHPINKEFRQKFLDISVNITMIKWLESLAKKNKEYELLQQQGVFSENELQQLSLPIRLVPDLVPQLYQRIKSIQDKLRNHPDITHNQLLEALYPMLYKYYRNIKTKHDNPLEAIYRLYHRPISVENTVNPKTRIYDGTLLTQIARRQAKIYDFEVNRTLSIKDATEMFMKSMDFSSIPEKEQVGLLIYLKDLDYIKHFEVHNCAVIDIIFVLHLLEKHPNITHLSLIDCKNIKEDSIELIKAKRPGIQIRINESSNFSETLSNTESCSDQQQLAKEADERYYEEKTSPITSKTEAATDALTKAKVTYKDSIKFTAFNAGLTKGKAAMESSTEAPSRLNYST